MEERIEEEKKNNNNKNPPLELLSSVYNNKIVKSMLLSFRPTNPPL